VRYEFVLVLLPLLLQIMRMPVIINMEIHRHYRYRGNDVHHLLHRLFLLMHQELDSL
jgi:hypothetical protein